MQLNKNKTKERNFVAKNDFNVGGVHESKKEKAQRPDRKKKHKGVDYELS